MGCKLSAKAFKHDDVCPVSYTPKNVTLADKVMATNGVIPKPEVKAREITPVKQDESKSTNNNDPLLTQLGGLDIMRVPDGEGSLITLAKFFGGWTAPMPALPAQVVRSQSFTFHDNDVILLGYAKSGSHWLWEMLHMLMKGRPEYCTIPKERLMLTFSTQEFFDTLDPPRVFNCHAPWQGLPPALRTGQSDCRMIYILRNPKDVAVSYYHQLSKQKIFDYEGSFHGYLDLFLEGKVPGGSWFDYVLGWEETMKNNPHLPLLVLHYEDTKEDTVAALRKVNEFLGLGRSEELLREVADCCTISKMRHMDQDLKHHLKDNPNVSKTGHSFMYRKGQVGDWKNYFSVADNNRFERMIKTKLKNSSLTFRYELEEKNDEDL